jgi:AbrB family looped-hinge helix DNA binding protein
MAKVTSKLQVTVPKRVADAYRIRPGDEVEFVPAGEVIRLVPSGSRLRPLDTAERLRLFDQATHRQRARQAGRKKVPAQGRGWTREELYDRGRAR